MAGITLGGAQSDVRAGGQIVLQQVFETFAGSSQGTPASSVTIFITAAPGLSGGVGTPVATTSAGISALDFAGLNQYTWQVTPSTPPGDYLVTWSGIVGSLTLTYVQTVTVAVMQSGTPSPGVYATSDQYRAWSGDASTPAQMVITALQRASEDIDSAIIGAVYAVNGNGMPTAPMVIDAFTRACCAQAQYVLADNDPSGIKRQFQTVTAGGVSTSRAKNATALVFPPLGPRTLSILHTAGVLPSASLIAWLWSPKRRTPSLTCCAVFR